MSIDQDALQEVAFAANDPRHVYHRVSNFIDNTLMQALTPIEYAVLRFILGRTLRYGKPMEHIPEAHFLKGVFSSDGTQIQCALPIGKGSLYRAIERLNDYHLIKKWTQRGSANKIIYMITVGSDFANVSGDFLMGLKTPKKLRESKSNSKGLSTPRARSQSHSGTNLSQPGTSLSHRETPIVRTDTKNGLKPADPAARPVNPLGSSLTIAEAVASATRRSAAARAKVKSKGSATAYGKVWADAWSAAYPEDHMPTLLVKDIASLRKAVERAAPADKRVSFIEWSVANYASVLKAKLRWAVRSGTMPQVGLFVSRVQVFYESFAEADDPNKGMYRKLQGLKKQEQTPEQKRIAELEKENMLLRSKNTGTAAVTPDEGERRQAKAIARRKDEAAFFGKPKRKSEFGSWGE